MFVALVLALVTWVMATPAQAQTDGATTWIDGPFGLEQRDATTRFWWESNPDRWPIVPPPQAGERCHTAGLALTPTDLGGVGVGHVGNYFTFTNTLDVPCTLYGYVGAQLMDEDGHPVPTTVTRGSGYLFVDQGPLSVTVSPGGAAQFGLEWTDVPRGGDGPCATTPQVAVIPPDEYTPIIVGASIMACGGPLHVTAVEPVR